MPGLLTRSSESGNAPANSGSGIWSKHRDSITFDRLQKFWRDLSPEKRQQLLRLDKQTLFEQARKNLYCSRCNGLLLEGFSQIIVHGKSLHQEGALQLSDTKWVSQFENDHESDPAQDPSVHPWGGLTTTRDGFLTVLDCFIFARSLRILQNVFNCARAREHEREMLYPDACGGGGRGWTSQGMVNYGRGYGTRETCALHTAKLSCDTLVDFWSALGEETRSSLLQMKEEDFIERLMYRFDSKRFCRDCRRNVIREFKELKELKRMRREPRCTSWFCVADSAFLYEVSEDTVQVDWHQSFTDTVGLYHHFEWAIGTAEGKSDILDFEDVGMNAKAQVNGLDLGGLNACFITLRAWRLDGRCTELCVKAHALKGQQCVHHRLIVRDGFVTITKGENIRRFFEHAEEAEEEEQEDDGIDKDGNELDGDVSRPQKHAKSPELAREFLLDAATVIYKEQVEKAFREGTARQNAHSIFVSLALKLLEERLHVACKEIITLEKQAKLLEEEEREKHNEEKRKERKRTKEREKKMRRKERLRGKVKGQENNLMESHSLDDALSRSENELLMTTLDEAPNTPEFGDTVREPDVSSLNMPDCPDIPELPSSQSINLNDSISQHQFNAVEDFSVRELSSSLVVEHTEPLKQNMKLESDSTLDCYDKRRSCLSNGNDSRLEESDADGSSSKGNIGFYRPSKEKFAKNNGRSCAVKFNERFHSSEGTVRDRYDPQFCSCIHHCNYRANDAHRTSTFRPCRGMKTPNGTERSVEMPKLYRSNKLNNNCYLTNNTAISKGKRIGGPPGKEVVHTKLVWEPLDAWKKCARSSSDSNISAVTAVDPSLEINCGTPETESHQSPEVLESADSLCLSEGSAKSVKVDSLNSSQVQEDKDSASQSGLGRNSDCQNEYVLIPESDCYSKNSPNEEVDCHILVNGSNTLMCSSSSDNCSSCLSEVDSSTSFSSVQNAESSSTSDSEDTNNQLNCRNSWSSNSKDKLLNACPDSNCSKNRGDYFTRSAAEISVCSLEPEFSRQHKPEVSVESHDCRFGMDLPPEYVVSMQNHGMHVAVYPPHTMSYYHRGPTSWFDAADGFFPMSQVNHYVFSGPLSYDIQSNRSSDFRQYTPIHPLNAPEFGPSRHTIHHMTNKNNLVSSIEPCKNISSNRLQQFNTVVEPIGSQRLHERSFSDTQLTSKPLPPMENCKAQNGAKLQDVGSAFSLFHYGGPVAGVAAGCNAMREESTGGILSQLPTYACSKEETRIKEYSLFSARNGARFSFF